MGDVNENVVYCAPRAKDYRKEVSDIVIVGLKETRLLACSLYCIAVLRKSSFGELGSDCSQINTRDQVLLLATIEIKMCVAASSLDASIKISSSNLILCDLGDKKSRKYLPKEHIGQLLHQIVVLGGCALYVSTADTDILMLKSFAVQLTSKIRFGSH